MLPSAQNFVILFGNFIILTTFYAEAIHERRNNDGDFDSSSSEGIVLGLASDSAKSALESAISYSESEIFALEDEGSTMEGEKSPQLKKNTVASTTASPGSSPAPTTYKETHLNPFAQAALSVPALQKFLKIKIQGLKAAALFFEHSYNTMKHFGAPNYASQANEISEAVAAIDVLTLPLYFQATGNAIMKFMLLEEIEILPTFPQIYASYIENTLLSSNVNGPVSLYEALLKAKFDFICSLVSCDVQKAEEISFLIRSEFIKLQRG